MRHHGDRARVGRLGTGFDARPKEGRALLARDALLLAAALPLIDLGPRVRTHLLGRTHARAVAGRRGARRRLRRLGRRRRVVLEPPLVAQMLVAGRDGLGLLLLAGHRDADLVLLQPLLVLARLVRLRDHLAALGHHPPPLAAAAVVVRDGRGRRGRRRRRVHEPLLLAVPLQPAAAPRPPPPPPPP